MLQISHQCQPNGTCALTSALSRRRSQEAGWIFWVKLFQYYEECCSSSNTPTSFDNCSALCSFCIVGHSDFRPTRGITRQTRDLGFCQVGLGTEGHQRGTHRCPCAHKDLPWNPPDPSPAHSEIRLGRSTLW